MHHVSPESFVTVSAQKSLFVRRFCSISGILQNISNPSIVGPATNWLKLT